MPDRALTTRVAGAAACVGTVAALAGASPAHGQARWTLDDHPPPPPGASFKVPVGPPGDLQFLAPDRGLLAIEGNATVARGLLFYDGVSWRQLSTVCGGSGDTTRIAWASPSEFWTITEPSLPRRGGGTSLCRFKDGQVVGSFSTAEQSSDPYRRMQAAACNGPNDCWFGGVAASDPSGRRRGTFHLHWNGSSLRSIYYPQDRAATDIEFSGGSFWESSAVGRRPEGRGDAPLPEQPEDEPRLLHRIQGEQFSRDPFVPRPLPTPDPQYGATPPKDATDLLALDADADGDLWAAGGGTASGACPIAPAPGSTACDQGPLLGVFDRAPVAVRRTPLGFQELNVSQTFDPGERFVDIAAIPGSPDAAVAVQRFADRRSTNARARVARIAPDGTTSVTALPTSGTGRGSAARVAFTGPNEGWMVTSAGWIFHLTDGAPRAANGDPAFAGVIDFRPNEAAAQFVSDAAPIDDSRIFAPPELEVVQEAPAAEAPTPVRLKALLTKIRSRAKGRTRIVISFTVRRPARIAVIARRGKRVVARTKLRSFKPGARKIVLKVTRKRYPTKLSFQIRERGQSTNGPSADDTGAGSGDTVTTGTPDPTLSDTVTTP